MVALAALALAGLVCWCDLDDEQLYGEEEMATIRKPGQGHAAPPSATTGELLNQRKIPRQIDYPVPPKPGPGPIQSAPGAREPVPPVNKPGGLPGTTTRVNVSAMGAAKKAQ